MKTIIVATDFSPAALNAANYAAAMATAINAKLFLLDHNNKYTLGYFLGYFHSPSDHIECLNYNRLYLQNYLVAKFYFQHIRRHKYLFEYEYLI